MYPGACAVIELGICETSSTPLRRSSTNIRVSVVQIVCVRVVGPSRKVSSAS
jgi:hypothetical protein